MTIDNLTTEDLVHNGSEFLIKEDLDPFGKLATILERRGNYLFIRYDSCEAQSPFYGSGKITTDNPGHETITPDPLPCVGVFDMEDCYQRFCTQVEAHEDIAKVKGFDINKQKKQDNEKD